MTPEEQARQKVDYLLSQAGWDVQNSSAVNLYASRGIAVREFRLKPGHGQADYLLYVDGKAAGVVEAKPEGSTLTGVEVQSGKYSTGLPDNLPSWYLPLPFLYESTGIETRFTNGLDPDPRSRPVFAFHRPETLAEWVGTPGTVSATALRAERLVAESGSKDSVPRTLRSGLRAMPPLNPLGLWPAQERAILNLETSLGAGRPRALVQMATGSGKTFMACHEVYRLVKYAGANRVLFLVDRGNLGRQTLREFQGFTTPDDGRKFTELYNVQHLQSNRIDPVSRVCISTIQRIHSMLKGEELDPELEELSGFDISPLRKQPAPVEYNPAIPIETFDVIITDECHRSIYNLWRQVLEYFDAFIIGMTATPSKQTFGFFNQNLVMEYNHEQAVADGVNVDFDVYRIRTEITEQGATVDAGYYIDYRDRQNRARRWEQLDEDLSYAPNQLDRDVVAEDQIRTVIRTFRDRLFTEIFPGRTDVPKTIIFAKDDSHADDIVEVVRQEFGKGNDFCQKITYRTTGVRPEDLIASFRNSYNPRIVVTVDMIATGTDIKPVEVVFSMRNIRSRNFFEQMKGRGVRVVSSTEFNSVTPDAFNKTRFVIVDAVGVTEGELSDTYSLEKQPSVSFATLLESIGRGNREPEAISSLASRLARLDRQLSPQDHYAIQEAAGGVPLTQLVSALVDAIDPDAALDQARQSTGQEDPPESAVAQARQELIEQAARPLAANPELRQRLVDIRRSYEQTIDTVSADHLIEAGYSSEAADHARIFIDEQGVHVTHAVFGWLKWTDESRVPGPGDEAVALRDDRRVRVVRSPLVFVPVNLERENRGWKVTLENNAVIETNIALEHAVDNLHQLRVEFAENEELTPDTVMRRWLTAIQGKECWEVYPGDNVIIDTFSFKKIALLREIERSKERIAAQPVLRALCGDVDALTDAPSVPNYESLDDALAAEDLSLVVPADASQIRAILAVNCGRNLVIQGPPGTGKSQTITNIISTMLSQGKRVLFVAEKRQARNIVVDNLTSAGLGELVLHITEEVLGRRSSSSSKKDIADQLGEVLNRGPGYFAFQPGYASNRQNIRRQLNAYDQRLHSPLGLSSSSKPFDLLGRWAAVQDDYPENLGDGLNLPSVREVDESWMQSAIEAAVRVDGLGEETLSAATCPWLDSALDSVDSAKLQEVGDALSLLVSCPNQLEVMTRVHGKPADFIQSDFALDAVDSLRATLSVVGAHHNTKQKFMGIVRPGYWKTRNVYRSFIKLGGEAPELASATAEELADYLHGVRASLASVVDAFPHISAIEQIRELAAAFTELLSSIGGAEAAIKTRSICLDANDLELGLALVSLVKVKKSGQSIRKLLELSLIKQWAQEAVNSDPVFDSGRAILSHLISVLKESEQEALEIAQVNALNAAVPYRPSNMDYAVPGGDLHILRQQISAKRRRPLRWLFSRAGVKILQIKPCTVASPLAVAQFLHSDAFEFDLVIFDEASQIPTADAVIPMSRATQVVVVGDSEQMPPTTFFDRITITQDDDLYDTYDSVLTECQSLLASRRLLWHYRSEDERLIAFSNHNFYNGELLTFPSSWDLHPNLGIKFVYLPDAVYGRGGSRANPEEAEKVVELLEEELTSNPEYTVGVTALSVAQSVEIQSRIEHAAEASCTLQDWLDEGGRARNLETIQGDEFDISILSFGYGQDHAGNVQLNFGPLSNDDGYKRLNVAVTRARKKTIVVTSGFVA
jgi:type I restriction enzyme R subunit